LTFNDARGTLIPSNLPSGEGGSLVAVHVRTLRRAVQIAGGEQQLAFRLKVVPSHLSLWLAGLAEPPGHIFLRAVDLVTENDLAQLSASVAPRETAHDTPSEPAPDTRQEDAPAS
jgi:hypothetical protein